MALCVRLEAAAVRAFPRSAGGYPLFSGGRPQAIDAWTGVNEPFRPAERNLMRKRGVPDLRGVQCFSECSQSGVRPCEPGVKP